MHSCSFLLNYKPFLVVVNESALNKTHEHRPKSLGPRCKLSRRKGDWGIKQH